MGNNIGASEHHEVEGDLRTPGKVKTESGSKKGRASRAASQQSFPRVTRSLFLDCNFLLPKKGSEIDLSH